MWMLVLLLLLFINFSRLKSRPFMYSWPLNNMGLNRTGSTYTWIFFNSKYYSTT